MKEKIYDARTGMEYALVDDYYLPALKLPRTRPIGRWGMLNKAYLKLRKQENQVEWVRRMSNLENRAAEIVKTELIYTFERW